MRTGVPLARLAALHKRSRPGQAIARSGAGVGVPESAAGAGGGADALRKALLGKEAAVGGETYWCPGCGNRASAEFFEPKIEGSKA
jgi:hypothetical protein